MSLNHISLTPQLLANLYPNTLIETSAVTTETTTSTMPSHPLPKFLGNNQKNILVLVFNDSAPFLPDNELAFLTSILSACKLSLADIAIMNCSSAEESSLQTAIRQLEAKHVLLFGIDPLSIGLPINFPHFQLQQFDKRTYLYSPAFSDLEKDKLLKTRLWNS